MAKLLKLPIPTAPARRPTPRPYRARGLVRLDFRKSKARLKSGQESGRMEVAVTPGGGNRWDFSRTAAKWPVPRNAVFVVRQGLSIEIYGPGTNLAGFQFPGEMIDTRVPVIIPAGSCHVRYWPESGRLEMTPSGHRLTWLEYTKGHLVSYSGLDDLLTSLGIPPEPARRPDQRPDRAYRVPKPLRLVIGWLRADDIRA